MRLFFIVVSFVFATSSVSAAQKDYKCFVETNVGKQISFFKWNEKQYRSKMAKLTAKRVNISGGDKKAYVKNTIECVELESEFQSSEAKKLDAVTLR